MQRPQLDPYVRDFAPAEDSLTEYDELHLITYLRLLDAEKAGADWQDVAKIVLHIDPAQEFERAERVWKSHLARAKWMTERGYQDLLNSATS